MKLGHGFYERDALIVAADILENKLCWKDESGMVQNKVITDVEIYRGEEDKACHACKGKTKRTNVMYMSGGLVYVYLIYGMYWMLNTVTGREGEPQAILIRGVEGVDGPGKVGKLLKLDKSFYGEDLVKGERIWIEDAVRKGDYEELPRVGVDYAGEWAERLWRFNLIKVK